jgi:hypothetical protein
MRRTQHGVASYGPAVAEGETTVDELRTAAVPSSPGRVVVMRGETPVATIDLGDRAVDRRTAVVVRAPLWTRDEARRLLELARDAAGGSGTVSLDTGDLLLRHEARAAGLAGELRQPLTGSIPGRESHLPPAASATHAERLGEEVGALVPRADITARAVRGMARRATSGLAAMIDLAVAFPGDRPFVVSCPDVADVVPEAIALAVDTLGRVRSRFPIGTRALARVSFDHSDRGLRSSKYAGMAHRNMGLVHLNASFASADGLAEMARRRRTAPTKRPPAVIRPPATAVDATTAHEAWHQIEAVHEATAYRTTIEFRRSLGEHFGVATLEHAVLGGGPDAPPEWRTAHERLVAEVSPYAGTRTVEATAEMFKLWWCVAEPWWTPAVRRFDQALGLLTSTG